MEENKRKAVEATRKKRAKRLKKKQKKKRCQEDELNVNNSEKQSIENDYSVAEKSSCSRNHGKDIQMNERKSS